MRIPAYGLLMAALGLATTGWADSVYLKDGSVVKGTIVKLDAVQTEVDTSLGKLKIPADRIERVITGPEEAEPPAAVPAKPPQEREADEPGPQQPFVKYDPESFYHSLGWAFGFSAGESGGAGLSAIHHAGPWALTASGIPITDGFSFGCQVQYDQAQFKRARIFTYAGASIYNVDGNNTATLGVGVGFGWLAFKVVGLSLSAGLAGHYTRGFTSVEHDYKITWTPDGNLMIHFYVF